MEDEIKDPLDSVRAFVSESKAQAFAEAYEQCSIDDDPDEIFDDAALRKFFDAYPKSVGDPLVIYLDEILKSMKFTMVVDPIRREPVLPVRLRL